MRGGCRVGEGEWKDSTGWVGMPGAAQNSFSVTAIECLNPVNSVSDVVELALDPTKIKWLVSSQCDTICFASRVAPERSTISWAGNLIDLPTDYGGTIDGSGGNPFATSFPFQQADDVKNFGIFAKSSVNIPRSGKWTFAGGTIGDGFRLSLSRLGSQWEFSKEPMGAQHFIEYVKTFDLEAGVYDLEFVFFNPNWHKQVSLGVAEGEYSSFQAGAFTAKVNGTVVAYATPGARTAAEICAAADFAFSSALVHASALQRASGARWSLLT